MRKNWIDELKVIWGQSARTAWRACACALFLALGLVPAHAEADPPSLAGRVASVSGAAWLFDADRNVWNKLMRNQTIAQGDRLRVDPKARVSLRIGSTSVWLDSGADLEISQMDEGNVLLRLEKGALGLGLRARDVVDDYRVQTREGQLFPADLGIYRIEQLPHGTRAQALQGRLRFESDRAGAMQRAWLRDGEQAEFWWADGPRVEHQDLLKDGFANWLLSQAVNEGVMANQDYVSPEMTGAEELDRNGVWQQSPEYGTVWIPSQVAPDWEPYRDGRWQWTAYWGWSWVDDMPWGFAPFHYGRWVMWRGRWCWTPGRYVARPVYAPAMVSWNRPPPVVAIGVTVRQPPPRGSWAPLPPREVYVPHFRHSDGYVDRLNRPHDAGPQRNERPPRGNPPPANPRDALPWRGSEGPRPSEGPQRNTPVIPSQPMPAPQVITANPPPPRPQDNAAPAARPNVEHVREQGWGREREPQPGNEPRPYPLRPRDAVVPQPTVQPQVPQYAPPAPQPQPQAAAQPMQRPQPMVQAPQPQRPQPSKEEEEARQRPPRKNNDERRGTQYER